MAFLKITKPGPDDELTRGIIEGFAGVCWPQPSWPGTRSTSIAQLQCRQRIGSEPWKTWTTLWALPEQSTTWNVVTVMTV